MVRGIGHSADSSNVILRVEAENAAEITLRERLEEIKCLSQSNYLMGESDGNREPCGIDSFAPYMYILDKTL